MTDYEFFTIFFYSYSDSRGPNDQIGILNFILKSDQCGAFNLQRCDVWIEFDRRHQVSKPPSDSSPTLSLKNIFIWFRC